MRFAIRSLSAIALFILFVVIAISIGTMSVIVLSAALCTVFILGIPLGLIGLLAWVIERFLNPNPQPSSLQAEPQGSLGKGKRVAAVPSCKP